MPPKPKTISLTPDEVLIVHAALDTRWCYLVQLSDDARTLPEMDLIDDVIDKLKES
ncbi:hypothetical protein LCGC14_1248850 [marine sediment metagenome]|uniref:Uncharacterized protein n=1 Tax=marine sediment metagenome TaxID=412755 RepID=A0A0F9L7F6_9ZZZZ